MPIASIGAHVKTSPQHDLPKIFAMWPGKYKHAVLADPSPLCAPTAGAQNSYHSIGAMILGDQPHQRFVLPGLTTIVCASGTSRMWQQTVKVIRAHPQRDKQDDILHEVQQIQYIAEDLGLLLETTGSCRRLKFSRTRWLCVVYKTAACLLSAFCTQT